MFPLRLCLVLKKSHHQPDRAESQCSTWKNPMMTKQQEIRWWLSNKSWGAACEAKIYFFSFLVAVRNKLIVVGHSTVISANFFSLYTPFHKSFGSGGTFSYLQATLTHEPIKTCHRATSKHNYRNCVHPVSELDHLGIRICNPRRSLCSCSGILVWGWYIHQCRRSFHHQEAHNLNEGNFRNV